MARDEAPPFDRGQTFHNGEAIDANDLGGVNLEGREYVFEDTIHGTGHPVRVRVVRNVSGAPLLPARLATLQAEGHVGRRADGHADATAEALAYPVDELLPAAGVPNNDLFYVVVSGPAAVVTANSLASGINPGDRLVSVTSATAATAGKVAKQDLTGATADLAAQVQNAVGVALSAATTGNTATKILAGVGW